MKKGALTKMTTAKIRLVFGSQEAQVLIDQSKKDAKHKEIKSKLKSIADELENLSNLTTSVNPSVGEFSEELWIVADWVNYLMIYLKEDDAISNVTEEAYNAWDNMIDSINHAMQEMDNDNPSEAYDILKNALQTDKYKPQFERLNLLTNNFNF